MGLFFINTDSGQVATMRQLVEARIAPAGGSPERPWHRIQGSSDASTLWYAVLRKKVRGVYIGALAIRHQPHHASLIANGWNEVEVAEIGVHGVDTAVVDSGDEHQAI